MGGVAASTAVLAVSLVPLSPAAAAMTAIPSTRTATSRGRHPVQLPRVLDYLVTQLAHACAHSAPAEQSCSDLNCPSSSQLLDFKPGAFVIGGGRNDCHSVGTDCADSSAIPGHFERTVFDSAVFDLDSTLMPVRTVDSAEQSCSGLPVVVTVA